MKTLAFAFVVFAFALMEAPIVFGTFSFLPFFGFTSAQSISVTITLNPSPTSIPVNSSNYFTISYTQSGTPKSVQYTGSPVTIQADANSVVTISATSSQSGTSEEWCFSISSNVCNKVSFTVSSSTSQVSYYYYDLLSFGVKYSVSGGGTGYSPPTVSYTTAPPQASPSYQTQSVTLTLSTTPTQIWALRGTQILVPQVLQGSSSSQRWATNVTSWTVGVSKPAPSNIVYYNQYLTQIVPSVSTGFLSQSNLATVLYTQFGGIESSQLSSQAYLWVDAGGVLGWVVATTGGNSRVQYSATPFTYGLVGYWPISEGVGTTIFDLSGKGNNAQAANSPVWVQSSSCLLGTCLVLNGVNQYVSATSTGIPVGSSPFTKIVWVYLPNGLNSQEENREILCWGGTSYTGASNCLATGSAPNQLVNSFGLGESLSWTSTHLVNGWNMIVVTYNGSVAQAYVNGVLEASAKLLPFVQSSQVYIGGGFPGYNYFDHIIQEVRIYNYAWSPMQVSIYYSFITSSSNSQKLEQIVTYPSESFGLKYFEQYSESAWYTVLGGGTPPPPTLTFYSLGVRFSTTLSLKPQTLWIDALTNYYVTNPLSATSSERWVTNQTNYQASLSGVIHLFYFNQFLLNVKYQVIGGGLGFTSPVFVYTSLGKNVSVTLSNMSISVWADNGTRWSVNAELLGSGVTQRWYGRFTPFGLVTSYTNLTFVYYHQFSVTFEYSIQGGGSAYSPPQVSYFSFGVLNKTPTGVSVWVDALSLFSFTNPLAGSTFKERWFTLTPNGTASSAGVVSVLYYHQFLLNVSYSVVGGGMPPTPLLNVTQFGSVVSYPLKGAVSLWVDSGGSYSVQSVLMYSKNERWISLEVTTGKVYSPLSVSLVYYHQYFVSISQNAQGGSVSPTSGWYNASSSVIISATAFKGWQFEGWLGSGASSYTGNASTQVVTITSPINEEAVFYPGLNVTVQTGGSVEYSFSGKSGSLASGNHVIYVPPGTTVQLTEKPIPILFVSRVFEVSGGFLPSNASVLVDAPLSIKALFSVNYVSVGAITLAIAIVIAVVALLRIRKAQA